MRQRGRFPLSHSITRLGDVSMEQSDVNKLKRWFAGYAARFYSIDEDVRKHASLKEEHTYKVMEHSREMASWLGLGPSETALAEVIALFHDVGRFRQYETYRTFVDHKSVDHARLGLEVIQGLPELDCLSRREREIFNFAIATHNTMRLPETADDDHRLFARIIRDADKLDIYRVLSGQLQPPSAQGFSPSIVRDLLAGTQSSYTEMRTLDDRKLMRLSWVYDINYDWTLERVVRSGYLEEIIRLLPQSEDIEKVVRRLREYILKRL